MPMLRYVASRILRGFVVFFPLGIAALLLAKVLGTLRGVSEKLAGSIPEEKIGMVPVATLIGILILLLGLFLLGVLVAPRRNPAGGGFVERKILNNIPGYTLLKSTMLGTIGMDGGTGERPAVLRRFEGVEELVLILEELEDGRFVVFLPSAPTARSGSIIVVRGDLVEPLEADIRSTLKVFTDWGVGAGRVLSPTTPRSTA